MEGVMTMRTIYAKTEYGMVMGEISGGFGAFKGIPFARAQRFCPPEQISWTGVKDCRVFGKKAMQVFDGGAPWAKPQSREEFDEDCLNLNIFIPEKALDLTEDGHIQTPDGHGLPVLVEIHGGAFQTGSNQEHTPRQMIRDNAFIYVAVNYRLGVLGFLYVDEILGKPWAGSGNHGILDLMAGVRWVYENIAAFGGDPERITLMGSSAGAKAMGAMMCRPELKKYVHQVIMSSGATQSIRSKATARATARGFMDVFRQILLKHGYDPQEAPKLLLSVPADLLMEAQKLFCDNPGNTCMFGPVADGVCFPEDCEEIIKSGTFWEGRAMIGSSRHELAFYKMMHPDLAEKAPEIADRLFEENAPVAKEDFARFFREYCMENGMAPSDDVQADWWVKILTDYMYRLYSYRLAARLAEKGCQVWQYTVDLAPALHCFDQQLAFGEPEAAFFKDEAHMEIARTVGKKIYGAFIGFIEKQDPNAYLNPDGEMPCWPCLDPKDPYQMIWDVQNQAKKIPTGDVLDRFPEDVYRISSAS